MKTHVSFVSAVVKNDPELQPSARMIEVNKQLKEYSHKAQENLKKLAECCSLPSDRVLITDNMVSIGGLDFFYDWGDVRKNVNKPSDFHFNMNIAAMGSFNPDVDSRQTRYYTTVARFMSDDGLRLALKTFVLDYIHGMKELKNELTKLDNELNEKINTKVNLMNAQIDKENYELQFSILKSIPANGNVFIIKKDGFNKTGFTYRNKPVLIAEKQEYTRNTKSVPARLVRNVGIG